MSDSSQPQFAGLFPDAEQQPSYSIRHGLQATAGRQHPRRRSTAAGRRVSRAVRRPSHATHVAATHTCRWCLKISRCSPASGIRTMPATRRPPRIGIN